ncbi:hypothetical protein GCM10010145_51780 [Streptomyces ruber]|uniref:Zinc-finger domain-containing protein n=2 Tax=Streptomyces TaxID=1883 RepID=A0A918EXC6_9ACTN|nr:hypothetical protein [Streptomyces ruber]GGQ75757.1 hypothetical protein GCM10010145_51780 [Streptomyces ruber]
MDCEQVRFDLAAEALTGRSEPEEEARAAHLARCPPCRLEHRELRAAVRLLADTVRYEPGPPERPEQ